jgi:hypothetical protein
MSPYHACSTAALEYNYYTSDLKTLLLEKQTSQIFYTLQYATYLFLLTDWIEPRKRYRSHERNNSTRDTSTWTSSHHTTRYTRTRSWQSANRSHTWQSSCSESFISAELCSKLFTRIWAYPYSTRTTHHEDGVTLHTAAVTYPRMGTTHS